MSAAILRVRAVAVLPLDFVGRLRILRTMHLPGALHGAEASLVSISGLRKLRTAFCQASLSGGLRLANPGAVLSLLDGPVGSDPGFHVVWCRFRMLRRHMAYNSSVHELARVYSLLRVVSAGAPGHGPVHLLVSSPLALCQISSPFQFFREAIWRAWRTKIAGDLSYRAGFRGGRYLDFRGSLKLLSSPHLRGGDEGLLRGILSGCVWNGFLLGFVKGEIVPCRFCGGPDNDMMDIYFGSALILLLFIFVRVLSFVIFCFVIGVLGLGVFFGMVGYLLLLVLVVLPLGPPLLRTLLVLGWRGCWVLFLEEIVGNGSHLIILLIVLSLLIFLIILMFRLMVALFLMSYPVLGLVGVVFTLLDLVQGGLVVGGVI